MATAAQIDEYDRALKASAAVLQLLADEMDGNCVGIARREVLAAVHSLTLARSDLQHVTITKDD